MVSAKAARFYVLFVLATLPLLLSPVSSKAQTTIHVPVDQPTIQTAINAAVNGDTVLVADGTYKENINFNGKNITVTSVNGASVTTIDGGGLDSVVSFKTNETSGAVLKGFTITNGFSNFSKPNFGSGGGIFISAASPRILNNTITSNKGCDGDGIFVGGGGSPLIQGNTISSNIQSACSGGNGGGGIGLLGSGPNTQVIGNVIANNSNGAFGGGIGMNGAGSPLIQNNIITGNNGGNEGGGIAMVNDESPNIVGNVIMHNTAFNGGGVYWLIPASTPGILLLNNTIAANSATNGSGVYADGFDSNATLQNNVIVGQPGFSPVFCGTFSNLSPIFIANDAFATGAAPYAGSCVAPTGTAGNISADPVFVAADVDNFHLQPTSPAIDTGNNTARIALPATDLGGNTRVFNTTVDMGAFEYNGTTTATLSASALPFPQQKVGTTSASLNVSIQNTGTTSLQISQISMSGDFSQTNTCRTSTGLAVGASCTLTISFSPVLPGLRTGQVTITSNAGTSPQIVSLSGTATAPVVSLSAPTLNFGNQAVGSTSAAQSVTLTNTGDAILVISSIASSSLSEFPETHTCGSSLAPSASCTLSVSFAPSVRGSRLGTITITDDATGSPHAVSLSGNGTGPAVTVAPASLVFASQLAGTTSPAQTVTLTSNGETALAISSITTTGDFGQTNNCAASLPTLQSCSIQVTFTPTAKGARTGALTITDDATSSPETVALSGTATSPVVTLSRTGLAFGNQVLDVAATATLTVSNTGDAILVITSISATGDFTQTNDCGTSLAAAATCTISVTFKPTALGARIGTLILTDSAPNSPQQVVLSGTGVQIGFSLPSLTFGTQLAGTTSATQPVTMTNLGASAISITGIVASTDFSQTNNCGASLGAGVSCTINIAFAPASGGSKNGLITVQYSGTQSTIAVSGSATDFTVAAQPGGSTATTVSAGQSATYNLSLTGSNGFSGSATLSCSGAPAAASCTVNPTSVSVSGTVPAAFTVNVTTTARAVALIDHHSPFGKPGGSPNPAYFAVLGLLMLAVLARKKVRYPVVAVSYALLLMVGCGGGGTTTPPPPVQSGTPAGTYAVVVTATSGSASRTLNLTLTVK